MASAGPLGEGDDLLPVMGVEGAVDMNEGLCPGLARLLAPLGVLVAPAGAPDAA